MWITKTYNESYKGFLITSSIPLICKYLVNDDYTFTTLEHTNLVYNLVNHKKSSIYTKHQRVTKQPSTQEIHYK